MKIKIFFSLLLCFLGSSFIFCAARKVQITVAKGIANKNIKSVYTFKKVDSLVYKSGKLQGGTDVTSSAKINGNKTGMFEIDASYGYVVLQMKNDEFVVLNVVYDETKNISAKFELDLTKPTSACSGQYSVSNNEKCLVKGDFDYIYFPTYFNFCVKRDFTSAETVLKREYRKESSIGI